MRELNEAWVAEGYILEGVMAWGIFTIKGGVVADDIEHEEFANHIVTLHNKFIEEKRESEKCEHCPHLKSRHGDIGCNARVLMRLDAGTEKCACKEKGSPE